MAREHRSKIQGSNGLLGPKVLPESSQHQYVQSCIAHVGFPDTVAELRQAYEAGNGQTDLERLLEPPEGHQGGWTAPRWLTTGDVLFFYHTKRAKLRVERFLKQAHGADNADWGEGDGLDASIEFLEDQLRLAERYAGTVFGCAPVLGMAGFEQGHADRHWRSNIYAPIDRVHIFERPLPETTFRQYVALSPGGALTPLYGNAFTGLKRLLAAGNELPEFLRKARPGGVSFRDVDATNWIDVVCSPRARFIDESQLRAYLIDYLLEAIKDDRTAVYQECCCEVSGGHPCYADYFVRIGGMWLPVEAKLNVSAERDLPGQVARYAAAEQFVPTTGAGKGKIVTCHCSEYCLVVDADGLYIVTRDGYVGCTPTEPLWRRTALTRRMLISVRDQLRRGVAAGMRKA